MKENNKRLNSLEKLEQRILYHVNNEDYFKTMNRIFSRLVIRLKEEKKPLKTFLEEVNNKHDTKITIQNLYDTINRIKPLDSEVVYLLHKEVLKITFSSEILDLCTQLNVDLDVIYKDVFDEYFYRNDSLAWNVVVKPLEKSPFCFDHNGVRIHYNLEDDKGRSLNTELYSVNLLSDAYIKNILGIEKSSSVFSFSIDDYFSPISLWDELKEKGIKDTGSFIFDLKTTIRNEFKPIVNKLLKDNEKLHFHLIEKGESQYRLYLTDSHWDIRDITEAEYITIYHKTIF